MVSWIKEVVNPSKTRAGCVATDTAMPPDPHRRRRPACLGAGDRIVIDDRAADAADHNSTAESRSAGSAVSGSAPDAARAGQRR